MTIDELKALRTQGAAKSDKAQEAIDLRQRIEALGKIDLAGLSSVRVCLNDARTNSEYRTLIPAMREAIRALLLCEYEQRARALEAELQAS